ncbi:hypothetical protein VF21_09708 [Pseudogymnoascus sp. 05NY08]|nr:hypothetical protein VF21_09708 [Pseudogymnoascus sp. 05NY08]
MASFNFAQGILFLLCCVIVLASASGETVPPPTYLRHQLRALASSPAYKSQNATAGQILKANKLVEESIAQQSLYNTYRVENPIRNSYVSEHSAQAKVFNRNKVSVPVRPTLNSTVLAAAKLLAERDAAAQHRNGTLHKAYRKPKHIHKDDGSAIEKRQVDYYWVEEIAHTGRSPLGGDPSYLANDPPIIKLAASFIGLGAVQTDVYYPEGSGGEWYIEQSNFYRQVRNFMIDIEAATVSKASGFHWQVAQATSLSAVYVYASREPGSTQLGMFTENGSGGFMSDCYFDGGEYGIYGGNQQYTVRNFEMAGQLTAAICLLWDWGWTWSGVHISLAPIGIQLINPEAPSGQQAGSTYLLDIVFVAVSTAIKAEFPMSTILESSIITLDNIQLFQVSNVVEFLDGSVLDIDASKDIDFIVIGSVEADGPNFGFLDLSSNIASRPTSLTDDGLFYSKNLYITKSRNQYGNIELSSIISVKDHGAVGNGVHDDSDAIIAALALATKDNLIYFPAGSYIVTKTILIPPHSRITGEVWSQIVASGSYFADMKNPEVMVRVGSPGDVGSVEISDMLFTSIGALPGLVMLEWNIQEDAPGSAAMWDSHFRVGGALGTQLQAAQCPPTTTIKNSCIAASMMMHITSSSSGYFENVWAWVADHDIDDPTNTQVTIAVARGILIESDGPTWFYGTASEHALLYQYNFFNTTDSLAAMIQTESPYFQYTTATESPGPFNSSIGLFANDPIFPDATCTGTSLQCNFAWAVIAEDATGVTIAGAGLYSWFDNLDQGQACVDAQDCQQRLIMLEGGNTGFSIFNLITIGAVEMLSDIDNSVLVLAKNNTQAIAHPFWSALGAYIDESEAEVLMCDDDDTSANCQTEPPCDPSVNLQDLLTLKVASLAFPAACTDRYAVGVLSNMLDATVANYTTVDDGYDTVFGYYEEYVKEMIPEALQAFMADPTPNNPSGGPGNKFFTCTFYQGGVNITSHQCPIDLDTLVRNYIYTVYYTLTNSTGFYSELESTYGVIADWVSFGRVQSSAPCIGNNCLEADQEQQGIPVASSNITVPNPKDIFTQSKPMIANLTNIMLSTEIDLNLGTWYGPLDDVIQVLSSPLFMLMQAVDSMQQVKTIGAARKAEDKKNLILEILGIIFAVLPFVSEGLGFATDLVLVGRIVEVVSGVGNAALSISDIVHDPTSAPMAIMGLLSGGTMRTESEFSRLASLRRGLQASVITKMGAVFKKNDDDLQSIVK